MLFDICQLGYPNESSPIKIQTSVIKSTTRPTWNFVCRIKIDRKRPFLRFVQRRKIQVQIFHSRFMMRHVLLGTAELPIGNLATSSTVEGTFPLAEGRKVRIRDHHHYHHHRIII